MEDASDEFLERLYALCYGLLCTSYAEGFGLPIAEASTYGMSILMRDLPVFWEFRGRHITYFRDDHPKELAQAVKVWLNDSAGFDRTTVVELQPSWADTTRQLLGLLGIVHVALPYGEGPDLPS